MRKHMFDGCVYEFSRLKKVKAKKTLADLDPDVGYKEDLVGPMLFGADVLGDETFAPVFVLEDPDDGQKSLARNLMGDHWIVQTDDGDGNVTWTIMTIDEIGDMQARKLRKDEVW